MEMVQVTPYRAKFYDGEDKAEWVAYFETCSEMLYECSKCKAFDDCHEMRVTEVLDHGMKWRYCGWQPCMVYEWVREDGETWVRDFPEWDH